MDTVNNFEEVKDFISGLDEHIGPTTDQGSKIGSSYSSTNNLISDNERSKDRFYKEQLTLVVTSHVVPHFLEKRPDKDYQRFTDDVSTIITQIVNKVMYKI